MSCNLFDAAFPASQIPTSSETEGSPQLAQLHGRLPRFSECGNRSYLSDVAQIPAGAD
jgi:hypothetical protein